MRVPRSVQARRPAWSKWHLPSVRGNDVREGPRVVPPARTPMPTQPTFTCATCDHQIAHHPVFHLGLAFCCAGCAADGPCMCSYDAGAELVTETRRGRGRGRAHGRDDQVPRALPADVPAEVGAVSAPPPFATLAGGVTDVEGRRSRRWWTWAVERSRRSGACGPGQRPGAYPGVSSGSHVRPRSTQPGGRARRPRWRARRSRSSPMGPHQPISPSGSPRQVRRSKPSRSPSSSVSWPASALSGSRATTAIFASTSSRALAARC